MNSNVSFAPRESLSEVVRKGRSATGGKLDETLDQLRPFDQMAWLTATSDEDYKRNVSYLMEREHKSEQEATTRAFELFFRSTNSAMYQYNKNKALIHEDESGERGVRFFKVRLIRDRENLRLGLYRGKKGDEGAYSDWTEIHQPE